jgi:hypothetical protein
MPSVRQMKVRKSSVLTKPKSLSAVGPKMLKKVNLPSFHGHVTNPEDRRPKNRVILKVSRWNRPNQKWDVPQEFTVEQLGLKPGQACVFDFPNEKGQPQGRLTICPDYANPATCEAVQEEVFGPSGLMFCQHRVQNQDERRVHCLLSCNRSEKKLLTRIFAGKKVAFWHEGQRLLGELQINKDDEWEFVQYVDKALVFRKVLDNLSSTWQQLIHDKTLELGHNMSNSPFVTDIADPEDASLASLGAILPVDARTTFYKYHGVAMKAYQHISVYPTMDRLSQHTAKECGLDFFNIGCDVLLYRDGNDKIGYHADDTQEETIIFTVVVLSEQMRRLHILPKGKKEDYKHGDFQIILNAGEGDAYSMDGK